MTLRVATALLVVLAAAPAPTPAAPNIIVFYGDTYAAIAYSEKTGKYGYSFDNPTRDIAETMARRFCKKEDPKADDAKVVTWVHNGWCALARGDDGVWGVGWSYGDGATNTEAKRRALDACTKRGKNARLVLCVCSLDRRPEFFDKD